MGLQIAKGSLSTIDWATETVYATAPVSVGTNYWNAPFVNEALDITANPIISAEIQPDRTVPDARQGNRASGGPLTTDLGIHRWAAWFQHLLGGGSFVTTSITATPLAAGTFIRGTYKTSTAKMYLCIVGGTETGTPTLTHTEGEADLPGGTRWAYVGADSVLLYQHKLIAGKLLPVGGITVEAGTIGGDVNLYQRFVGGRVGMARITIPQDGLVQVAWELLFQRPLLDTSTPQVAVAVPVSDSPIIGYESMMTLQGAENYDLRDGNFEISNNLDANAYRIGSRDRKAVVESRREIKGSFNAYFTDADLYHYFTQEVQFTFLASFYRKGAYMSFEFPQSKFFGSPRPKTGGPGVVTASFDLQSFKGAGVKDAELIIKSTNSAAIMGSAYGIF